MRSEFSIGFAYRTMLTLEEKDSVKALMFKASLNTLAWVLDEDPPYPELYESEEFLLVSKEKTSINKHKKRTTE